MKYVFIDSFSYFKARFALKFISGAKKLPSKSEMLADIRAQTYIQWNKGYSRRFTHFLGPEQNEYFEQLSKTAEIENLPLVLANMHEDSRAEMFTQKLAEFRNFRYTVIDDKTFYKEKYEN